MEGFTTKQSLLDPLERVAEIMFGLIMTLTFTCTISIAVTHRAEIRELLIAAVGCNIAWGFVDATMYLIGVLAHKNRNKIIFDYIQHTSDADKAKKYITDSLPPIIGSIIEEEELEQIRNKLKNITGIPVKARLTSHDLKKAMALWFLVFMSTFPVVLPFIFIKDATVALRVSNFIAILLMFLCGWSVAKYVGYSKWKMSTAMIVIGFILVALTVALGG